MSERYNTFQAWLLHSNEGAQYRAAYDHNDHMPEVVRIQCFETIHAAAEKAWEQVKALQIRPD